MKAGTFVRFGLCVASLWLAGDMLNIPAAVVFAFIAGALFVTVLRDLVEG